MPIDRFSVLHRCSVPEMGRLLVRRAVRGLADPLVRPFQTQLATGFVVGCGHSGTTLLAAKLSRLPGCFVPGWETSFFLPDHGLAWSKAAYGALLRSAESEGASVLLEKTPKHIHCVPRIRRLLPHARFLLITRNPLDTCASLYRRFGDLDYAIERWNLDGTASLKLRKDPLTLTVRYESLTHDPSNEFRRAAEFLGLPWSSVAIEPGDTAYSTQAAEANMLRRAEEVAAEVLPRVGGWQSVLTSDQVAQVRESTRSLAKHLDYLS